MLQDPGGPRGKAAAAALLLVALLAAGTAPSESDDQGSLVPGASREAEVSPGTDHAWTVATQPGHVYDVRVEQLGANLEVRWAGDGESRRVDRRLGRSGDEVVWWVAQAAGTATLTVQTVVERPARYRITLAPTRPASAADLERQAAEKAAAGRDTAALRGAADGFGRLGLKSRQSYALKRLSDIARNGGETVPSRLAADECVALARQAGLDEDLAECLVAQASVAADSGNLELAGDAYRQALVLRERQGDPGPIAGVLADMATNVLVTQGDYTRAEELLRRALDLDRAAGDEFGVALTEGSLATLAGYRGDLEGAIAAQERAAEMGRRKGRFDIEVLAAANVGLYYNELGDVDRSLSRFRQAAVLAEARGLKPALTYIRLAMGSAYEDAGDLEASARELEAALTLAREISNPEWEAYAEQLLGWTRARQGRAAPAEEHFARGIAVAGRQHALPAGALQLYMGKARILSGRLADAEAPLLEAQRSFAEMGHVDAEARAWTALAELSLARGALAAAADHAARAVAGFDSVRARVALGDRRAHYSAFRREAYDVAVEILVERNRKEPGRGHLAEAFAMTERARGRTLFEEVAVKQAGGSAALPPELSRRHRAALDRIGHLQRELVSRHTGARPDPSALADLERQIQAAVGEEEAARRAIREAAPRRALLEPQVLPAASLSSGLAADEALIEYHVAAKASWLFLLRRTSLQVFALPGDKELRTHVDALRRHLARPSLLGAPAYATLAQRLFDTVLGPASASLQGVRRLRIVPDGPLWEIPFEALVTGPSDKARYGDLPYLLRRWTVSYQPSAGEGAAQPDRPAWAGAADAPELIAFADPSLPAQGPRGEAGALLERAVFREGDRWSLPPLPCAAREAREAAALFGSRRARVYLGDAALESRVKSDGEVARARYLLFSTHALLSETMPSQSSLVLSLGRDGSEDGLLQVHEIGGLALNADLVVLSACESALGRNLRGEGLLGLSRSFLQAGARRLVASLWRVADCSTADLVTGFFSGLTKTGSPAPEALRNAKLDMLRRREHAHPYYWGAFVLVGMPSGEPGPRPE